MTPRERARRAARLAAYGSETAFCPADYTLLQALEAMEREVVRTRKRKKGDDPVADEAALGPIFESEENE